MQVASMFGTHMYKYAPEGSAEIFHAALTQQRDLALPGVICNSAENNIEREINNRLLSLGSSLKSGSHVFKEHLLWFIDNYPRHIVHQFIILRKKNSIYQEGRIHWLELVDKYSDDVAIRFHAGIFLSALSPVECIESIKKAAELDLDNDEFPRFLSQVYAIMAESTSLDEGMLLAKKSIEEILRAIERYKNVSAVDSYLLPYFSSEVSNKAELAFKFELLEEAFVLGEILLDHRKINSKRNSGISKNADAYKISEALGHSILGRVALAKGNKDEAIESFLLLMKVPLGTRTDWNLANELLQIGETQIVVDYIELFESRIAASLNKNLSVSEKERSVLLKKRIMVKEWLKKIKSGNLPILY